MTFDFEQTCERRGSKSFGEVGGCGEAGEEAVDVEVGREGVSRRAGAPFRLLDMLKSC